MLLTAGQVGTSTELANLSVVRPATDYLVERLDDSNVPVAKKFIQLTYIEAVEELIQRAYRRSHSLRHQQLLGSHAVAVGSHCEPTGVLQLAILRAALAVQTFRFCQSLEECTQEFDKREQRDEEALLSTQADREGGRRLSRKQMRKALKEERSRQIRTLYQALIENRIACLNAFLTSERSKRSPEALAKLLDTSLNASQLLGSQYNYSQASHNESYRDTGHLSSLLILSHRLNTNIPTDTNSTALTSYVHEELKSLLGTTVMGAVDNTAPGGLSSYSEEDNNAKEYVLGGSTATISSSSTLYLRDNVLFQILNKSTTSATEGNSQGPLSKEATLVLLEEKISLFQQWQNASQTVSQTSLLDSRLGTKAQSSSHKKKATAKKGSDEAWAKESQTLEKELHSRLSLSSIAAAFGYEHFSLIVAHLEHITRLPNNIWGSETITQYPPLLICPPLRLCPTSFEASIISAADLFSRRRPTNGHPQSDISADDAALPEYNTTQLPGGSQRLTVSALEAHTATQPPLVKPINYGGSESVYSDSAAAEAAAKVKEGKTPNSAAAVSDELNMSAISREDSYKINRVPSMGPSEGADTDDGGDVPVVLKRDSGTIGKKLAVFASPSSPRLAKRAVTQKRARSESTATSASRTLNRYVGRRHETATTTVGARGTLRERLPSVSSVSLTEGASTASNIRPNSNSSHSKSFSRSQQRLRSVQSYANKFRHSDGRSGTTMQEYDDTTEVTLAVPDVCRFAMDTGVQVSIEHVPIPPDHLLDEVQWQLREAKKRLLSHEGGHAALLHPSQDEDETDHSSLFNRITTNASALRLLLLEHYRQTLPFSLDASLDEVAERVLDLETQIEKSQAEHDEQMRNLVDGSETKNVLERQRLVSILEVARRQYKAAKSDPKWELLLGDTDRAVEAVRKSPQMPSTPCPQTVAATTEDFIRVVSENKLNKKEKQQELLKLLVGNTGFDIHSTPPVVNVVAAIQTLTDEALVLLSASKQEADHMASHLIPNVSAAAQKTASSTKERTKNAAARQAPMEPVPMAPVTLTFAVVSCVACESVLSLPICIPNDPTNRHHATMPYSLQQHVLHHASSARHRRQAAYMGVEEVTKALSIPFTITPYYSKLSAMHRKQGQDATGSYTIMQVNGISTLVPVRNPQGATTASNLSSAGASAKHPLANRSTNLKEGAYSQDWVTGRFINVSQKDSQSEHQVPSAFDWRRIVGAKIAAVRCSDTEVNAYTVKMISLFDQLRQEGTLAGQLQRHANASDSLTDTILQSLKGSKRSETNVTSPERAPEQQQPPAVIATSNTQVHSEEDYFASILNVTSAGLLPPEPAAEANDNEDDDNMNRALKMPAAVWSPLSALVSLTVNTFAAGGFSGGSAVLEWYLNSLGQNMKNSFANPSASSLDCLNHFIHAHHNISSVVTDHLNKLLFAATVAVESLKSGMARLRPAVRDSFRQRVAVKMLKVGREGLFDQQTYVSVVGFQDIASGLGEDEAADEHDTYSSSSSNTKHNYRHTALLRYRHSCACLTQVIHVLSIIVKEMTAFWESIKRRLSMLVCQLQVRQAAELGLLPTVVNAEGSKKQVFADNTPVPSAGFLHRQQEEKLLLMAEMSNLMLTASNLMLCSFDALGSFFRSRSAEVFAKPVSVFIPAECSVGKWSANGAREPAPTVFRLSLQPIVPKRHIADYDAADGEEEDGEGEADEEEEEEA